MWYKRSYFCFLLAILLMAACKREDVYKGRTAIACIGDTCLYKDETDLMYAIYGQGLDSVRFVSDYIERWAVEHLFYKKVYIEKVNFIPFDELKGEMKVCCKLRYRHTEQPATIRPYENGVLVEFSEPQRAPSPGQAAVF